MNCLDMSVCGVLFYYWNNTWGCKEMNKYFQEDVLPIRVSVADAAKYLGLGRKVIYQLLEFGELRAVRERGTILIDPCSLREFRESGKQP